MLRTDTHRPVLLDYSIPPQAEGEQIEQHPIERAGARLSKLCEDFSAIVCICGVVWLVLAKVGVL